MDRFRLSERSKLVIEIVGMGACVVAFAGWIYWLYTKRYAQNHPQGFDSTDVEIQPLEEHVVVRSEFDKPGVDVLVRDDEMRQDRIDYRTISHRYATQDERIQTSTTQIIKEARGTDKGRDALDGYSSTNGEGPDRAYDRSSEDRSEIGYELEIEESSELDGVAGDAFEGSEAFSHIGSKKDILIERDLNGELPEDFAEDENGVSYIVKRTRSTYPMGKSRGELANRFKVIDKFEFEQTSEYFEKHTGYFFAKDEIIAGFDGELIEIRDEDLLAMVYDAVNVRGMTEVYLRDIIQDIDFHIVAREDGYEHAYEEWVLSKE